MINIGSRRQFLKLAALVGATLLPRAQETDRPEIDSSKLLPLPGQPSIPRAQKRAVKKLEDFQSEHGRVFARKQGDKQIVIIPWVHPQMHVPDIKDKYLEVINHTNHVCAELYDHHGLTAILPEGISTEEAIMIGKRRLKFYFDEGFHSDIKRPWLEQYQKFLEARSWRVRATETGYDSSKFERKIGETTEKYLKKVAAYNATLKFDSSPKDKEDVGAAIAREFVTANREIDNLFASNEGQEYSKNTLAGRENLAIANSVSEIFEGGIPGIIMGGFHYFGLTDLCDSRGMGYVSILPNGVDPPKRSSNRERDLVRESHVPREFYIDYPLPNGKTMREKFTIDEN